MGENRAQLRNLDVVAIDAEDTQRGEGTDDPPQCVGMRARLSSQFPDRPPTLGEDRANV
ncbi:hypothetical protein [Streptomyces sp. RerS4]|uniref:hypothetical protein n=1 Tax=Streptomyces sp. RerS4 TaxID=2942449 RepID=UPI00201C514F|nr:hypothetical protein [Streptomyces sp. RerS4]UQX04630.1 hypothetical protein M4D82_32045 [Streptomyces sp. RerS4]